MKFTIIIFFVSIQLAAQSKSDLVAAVLVLEAQNQNKIGMQAVFEVIKNRAKSTKINPIYTEARRPKQFSCLNNISDSIAIERARKSVMWPVAIKIIKSNQNTNLTNGARHYYADWLKPIPSWARKVKSKKKIGNHIFCNGVNPP